MENESSVRYRVWVKDLETEDQGDEYEGIKRNFVAYGTTRRVGSIQRVLQREGTPYTAMVRDLQDGSLWAYSIGYDLDPTAKIDGPPVQIS